MSDKVCIITGASRGIGLAIAKRMSMMGLSLVLISRHPEKLEEIVKDLDNSNKHLIYGLDVSDYGEVGKTIKDIMDKKGQIDYLVNNAGITKDTLLIRMKEEDWDSVININLKGVFNFTKHTIPYMAKKRFGKIINISSIVGLMGNPGQSNYAASKSGIIGFTKSIAKEYGSKNITANVVAPGFVETDMTKRLSEKVIEDYKKAIPLRRFASPEDIANVVEFLISPSSDYITGEVINVSGGLYI